MGPCTIDPSVRSASGQLLTNSTLATVTKRGYRGELSHGQVVVSVVLFPLPKPEPQEDKCQIWIRRCGRTPPLTAQSGENGGREVIKPESDYLFLYHNLVAVAQLALMSHLAALPHTVCCLMKLVEEGREDLMGGTGWVESSGIAPTPRTLLSERHQKAEWGVCDPVWCYHFLPMSGGWRRRGHLCYILLHVAKKTTWQKQPNKTCLLLLVDLTS